MPLALKITFSTLKGFDQFWQDCSISALITLIKLNELLLGKPVRSIIDEFLEKFQTAFDPPPPFFGKNECCDFFQNS